MKTRTSMMNVIYLKDNKCKDREVKVKVAEHLALNLAAFSENASSDQLNRIAALQELAETLIKYDEGSINREMVRKKAAFLISEYVDAS